jgi:hypothetical protein
MDPLERRVELVSGSDAVSAIRRVAAALQNLGAQTTSQSGGLRAKGGSRLALRMWGVFLPPGRNRLPWRADVRAADDGDAGTRIEVQLRSDEGKYLFRIAAAEHAYSDLFDKLLGAIAGSIA